MVYLSQELKLDTTGELNKLFQEASNIGGMTLN